MVQVGTKLNVADNSGAKVVQCINILGGTRQRSCSIGDRIVVAVKKASGNGVVKKSDLSDAVVVRTVKKNNGKDGNGFCFSDNAVVLINRNCEMKGTRVFGPVGRDLKKNAKFSKIISLASEVI